LDAHCVLSDSVGARMSTHLCSRLPGVSEAVRHARELAAQHPGSRLSCPTCAAVVNAGNLDRHLAEHPMNVPGSDQRAGLYLRVNGGGKAITVRCRSGGQLRKVWTGWVSGSRSRRWDITLAAADFVALQYALARSGALRLRDA
jgi:hypothetical protein